MKTSRRRFIKAAAACAALAAGAVRLLNGFPSAAAAQQNRVPDRGPRLDLGLVKEFVTVGHGDVEGVKRLLAREPKLINAAWDWGGGDWETALGGAAHMGNREIAQLLLSRGARIDLFAAAMLGQLEFVKAAMTALPDNRNTLGPHGLTLLHHARAGGKEAEAVFQYLESLK